MKGSLIIISSPSGGGKGTLIKGLYANWNAKSPSDTGIQQCSGLLSSGLWEDRSCTALQPFICESP